MSFFRRSVYYATIFIIIFLLYLFVFNYYATQNNEKLLKHYIYCHQINEINYYFKKLFSLDRNM